MYTKCPECNAVCRVTAKDLQRARGRVRCGGCDGVFNAIDHLTEDEPGAHDPGAIPGGASGDERTADDVLAETNKQLLVTLDELAGAEDVRIEDTGTEWLVLGAEFASGEASAPDASQETTDLANVTEVPADARRNDDNTPLAENPDGESRGQDTPRPVPPLRSAAELEDRGASEFEESRPDLTLSEPEDWTDSLDDVSEGGTASDNIPLEVEEELAAIHNELSAKEDPLPLDEGFAAGRSRPAMGSATYIHPVLKAAPTEAAPTAAADIESTVTEDMFVHGSLEKDRLEAENEARSLFGTAGSLLDTDAARRGGRRSTDPTSYGVIAGTILLVLLMLGQVIHAHRETLSTYGLFNQTIGPVYRLLGIPVTPEWDIRGWRFEATNGNIAEDEDVLTIFSRIGNNSLLPLPYPLMHVSLTDRWEEIIGSRVLMPNEYLAGDLDPSRPVIPGENFTAVITIDEPSVDATGFKLNVCYRVSPGRVRCATEDFKD